MAYCKRWQITVSTAFRSATQVTRFYSTSKITIEKLLVANRGEIACRVIRTARRLGIKTVAVYSDVDMTSLHVTLANEAYNIGPAASQLSYLNKEKILSVAKVTGSQAIHPGYGFLSENSDFAEMCQEQGIIFVGPPASAIRDMGIKSKSKSLMRAAGVPIIHGYHGDDQSVAKLTDEAERIGFPVMIKAVRGGGGKGMRIAMTSDEFVVQLESAKREAAKSFGDDVMLVEKYVDMPRHVEVQVFGDHHGNYVYLFERDCSVQRRHQKIIEEAPAPGLSDDTRRKIGEAAVRAAKAVHYIGAGTVEFIMDSEQNFYFMEMNTRLQVEHPVTEMITKTDLVEWQLKVAAGEKLPLQQVDIRLEGHAFEARIYAEDPENNFMPGAGSLLYLKTPVARPDVRIETGVEQGDEVSVHYDPMIAKLVVWSDDRCSALRKLRHALLEYNVVGLPTNIGFLDKLASHADFIQGNVHTGFIPLHEKELFTDRKFSPIVYCQAALALTLIEQQHINTVLPTDPFSCNMGSTVNGNMMREVRLIYNDEVKILEITYQQGKHFTLTCDDVIYEVEASLDNKQVLHCIVNGCKTATNIYFHKDTLYMFFMNGECQVAVAPPSFIRTTHQLACGTGALAPMPGVIDKVMINVGEKVEQGDALLVIIAMKMEYVVRATKSGVIKSVLHKPGETVPRGRELIHIE